MRSLRLQVQSLEEQKRGLEEQIARAGGGPAEPGAAPSAAAQQPAAPQVLCARDALCGSTSALAPGGGGEVLRMQAELVDAEVLEEGLRRERRRLGAQLDALRAEESREREATAAVLSGYANEADARRALEAEIEELKRTVSATKQESEARLAEMRLDEAQLRSVAQRELAALAQARREAHQVDAQVAAQQLVKATFDTKNDVLRQRARALEAAS